MMELFFAVIDDKNQVCAKGLIDEVFGEENFVTSVQRVTCSSKTTRPNHESQKNL